MSSERRYAVKETFLTIQGEGANAGRVAVFVRFAGCNVWSGREEDRARDAARGVCAAWCDTDFRGVDGPGGGAYTAQELAQRAFSLWPMGATGPSVVLTGGEPSLQLDAALVSELKQAGFQLWVETNGSRPLPAGLDWICLSPKPPKQPVIQRYDEVKVVYPVTGLEPEDYVHFAPLRYLQPRDDVFAGLCKAHTTEAVRYVISHPHWRLSIQSHKILGIP